MRDSIPAHLTPAMLEEMLKNLELGAISEAPVSQQEMPGFVEDFLANLTRDRPFNVALDNATASPVSTIITRDFFETANARGAIGALAQRSEKVGYGFDVAIPHVANHNLGLGTSSIARQALSGTFRGQMAEIRFDAETSPSLGTLSMQQRLDDIASGTTARSADFQIKPRGDDDSLGEPLGDHFPLVQGAYVLAVALREVRRGIGFDTRDAEPVQAKGGGEIVVAVCVKSDRITMAETVLQLALPPEGDSPEILFPFEVLEGCPIAEFDVRFYARLNLIEHITITAYSSLPPPNMLPHLSVSQPISFERFSGDLNDACPPRKLAIQISSVGEQFYLTVAIPDDRSVKLISRPGLAQIDLAAVILELRQLWLRIALDTFQKGLDPKLTAFTEQDLLALAKAGRHLWSLLFEMDLDSIKIIGETLRSSLERDCKIQITIDETAQTFVFPWALVYDGDPPEKATDVDPQCFWGIRCDIEQVIQRRKFRRPRPSGPRRVALFFNSEIGQARDLPEKICDLARAPGAMASVDMPPVEDRDGFESRMKSAEDDLLYFYCHGQTALPRSSTIDALRQSAEKATKESDRPEWFKALFSSAVTATDSLIMLTDNQFKLSELWSLPSNQNGVCPIVILNMCESAQLFPDVGSTFVKFFLNRPARAVLGTECPVPPVFAADFWRTGAASAA